MLNIPIQHVGQQLTNMLNLVSKKGENSGCWSTVNQHVDMFSVSCPRVDQQLINMLSSPWKSTWCPTIEQEYPHLQHVGQLLINIARRRQHVDQQLFNCVIVRSSRFARKSMLLLHSWTTVEQQLINICCPKSVCFGEVDQLLHNKLPAKINMLINFRMISHGWIQHVDQFFTTLTAWRPFNMLINSWSTLKRKSRCRPRFGIWVKHACFFHACFQVTLIND